MLYNQINIIVSHIHKEKISNSFDITNLQEYFFTKTKKDYFDNIYSSTNVKSIQKTNYHDVQNVLEEKNIYNKNTTNYSQQHHLTLQSNSKSSKQQDSLHNNSNLGYIIKQKDTLFWSLYILHHGYMEYIKIQINYGNIYLNENQKVYNKLKNDLSLMKQCNTRMTKTLFSEILSDIVLYKNDNTNYNSLYAYICYYKFNLIIINKEKDSFLHFKNEVSGSKTHILEFKNNKYYIIDEDVDETIIHYYYNNYIPLIHFNKAMKGVSTYKLDELRKMGALLKLDCFQNKNDLYTSIYKHISW